MAGTEHDAAIAAARLVFAWNGGTACPPMKLLLLNGNTDAAMTGRLVAAARRMYPLHELVGATARFGERYIASRRAAAVAAHAVVDGIEREVGERNAHGYDAVVIACFGDPGLEAAREICPVPVLGLADASLVAARRIAPRIALLTGGAPWVPMLREFALLRGLGPEEVRIAAISLTGGEIARDPEGALPILAEAACDAVADGRGALVLGGAGLVGLAPRLRKAVGVPVLDCLEAALGEADAVLAGAVAPDPAG